MFSSRAKGKTELSVFNISNNFVCVIWNDICLCFVYLSLSGAAKDHWTTWLWGCGVSEKGSDPQRPSPRPAALPCGRCLGESLYPFPTVFCPLGLALTQVIFLSCAVYPVVCCLQTVFCRSVGVVQVILLPFLFSESATTLSFSSYHILLRVKVVVGWLAH